MANFSTIARALLVSAVWAVLGLCLASTALAVDTLDFGQHLLGTEGEVQTIALENDGIGAVTLGQTIVRGANADVFSLETDGCSLRSLAEGEYCEVVLRFRPSRLHRGSRMSMSADLVVPDVAGGEEVFLVQLRGLVLRPPTLIADSAGLRLAPVLIGEVGQTYRFSARNAGDVDAHIGQLNLVGSGASQFALVSDSCASLVLRPIFGGCFFELRFQPTQEGIQTASVVVSGGDTAATTAMPVTATAERPDVADGLRLIAWNAGLKVAGRRLGRRLSTRSILLGAHTWPIAGQLEASLSVYVRGRKRVLATGTQTVGADSPENLRLRRGQGARRKLRRASRSAMAIIRLELTEPSGRQTVGIRRLRVRGG